MSRESRSERTQRTVAELLAQHGGSSPSGARRRRRRGDEADDSAPQTIIQRVLSDSGRLQKVADDESAQPQQPEPAPPQATLPPLAPAPPQVTPPPPQVTPPPTPSRRSAQQPPTSPRHVPPHEAAATELPVRSDPPAPSRHGSPESSTGYAEGAIGYPAGATRYEGPADLAPSARPVPPPPLADAELTTEYPPITDDTPPPPPLAPTPPVPTRPGGGPTRSPRPAPAEPLTEQIPRIDEALELNLREALDPNLRTDIALPPISAAPPRRDVSAAETTWFQTDGFAGEHIDQHGPPTEYVGEGYQDEGYQDEGFEEEGFEDEGYEGEEEGYHQDSYEDEDYQDDEYAETEYAPHAYDDEDPEHVDQLERVDGDDDDAEGLADEHLDDDEFAEEETRRSPAKEWLVMVGQLGAGVTGGAGLWLGFQWLWRVQPAAALGGAVMIIVGLVWMVRKIRRADDLQTTFLAVLVGLVVTVSPAALLLVGR